MIPPRRSNGIAPSQPEVDRRAGGPKGFSRRQTEIISPIEDAEVETVTISHFPVDFPIEVIEEIARVCGDIAVAGVDGIDDGVQQQIDIRAPPTDHEGGLVLDQGAFECQLRRED